jgi:hypothetical protein
MDNDASAVRLAGYRHFAATGRAPSGGQIADALGRSVAQVSAAFERLAAERALVLFPGTTEIWMAMPFSAVPTELRVETEKGPYWANCAWDALGIPAALGADAKISSRCSDCGESLRIEVSGGECSAGLWVHFGVPAAQWWQDIGFTWATIRFFRSEDHARAWCSNRRLAFGAMATVEQVWR